MAAKDNLQPLQFSLAPDKSGGDYHMLEARSPSGETVGYMSWARKDTGFHQKGEIANIRVDNPAHRRQGIATAMYHHAVDNISPTPLHSYSQTRTGGGADWASYVGGDYTPKRYVHGPDAQ